MLQPVRDAGVEVLHAVGGGRVHDAGAVVGGGVVGQVHRRSAAVALVHMGQRVVEVQAAQGFTQRGGEHRALQAVALQAFLHQGRGQDEQAAFGLHQRVLERRVQVQRLVGRQRPGGGGPDDGVGVLVERGQAERFGHGGKVLRQEGHVHRGRGLVRILDLELGQRRAAVKAPVHRLAAAVDEAALHQALEHAHLAGLVARIHGAVGVGPVAQHAQALEVLHLLCDLLGGEGPALGLHHIARQAAAVQLLDGVLDRQTVAVPTWHVACVIARQLARLDDHVLEHLVQRVADVQLAVGIRWAVMQHEQRRAVARHAQSLVQATFVPLLHPPRLALGQIAAHGEGRVGQVQGGTVVRGIGGGAGGGGAGAGRARRRRGAHGLGERLLEALVAVNRGRSWRGRTGGAVVGCVSTRSLRPEFGRAWSGGACGRARLRGSKAWAGWTWHYFRGSGSWAPRLDQVIAGQARIRTPEHREATDEKDGWPARPTGHGRQVSRQGAHG